MYRILKQNVNTLFSPFYFPLYFCLIYSHKGTKGTKVFIKKNPVSLVKILRF